MGIEGHLPQCYQDYLLHILDPKTAIVMKEALHEGNLEEEAKAIQIYLEKGVGAEYVVETGPWQSRKCIVSDHCPDATHPGDMWFDLVELTFMICIDTKLPYRRAFWLSTHPVYVWQFRAFLDLARWIKLHSAFPVPSDLFSPERIDSQHVSSFVNDIYHEEGAAYALWFRKTMVADHLLKEAQTTLTSEEFAQILPPSLRLWDGLTPTEQDNDIYRQAIGIKELNRDPQEPLIRLPRGRYKTLKEMSDLQEGIYEIWDRDKSISMVTACLSQSPLNKLKAPPPRPFPAFYYAVALTDFGPRPSIDFNT